MKKILLFTLCILSCSNFFAQNTYGQEIVLSNLDSRKISIDRNPAHEKFTLSGINTFPVTVTVYNILGSIEFVEKRNKDDMDFDISELHTGTYLLHIISPNKVKSTIKLIKL